jgi:hypothetical protein
MNRHFEVSYEGPKGERTYRKGSRENFGPELGFQEPETLTEEGGYVVIRFDRGARVRIPAKRVIQIVEG